MCRALRPHNNHTAEPQKVDATNSRCREEGFLADPPGLFLQATKVRTFALPTPHMYNSHLPTECTLNTNRNLPHCSHTKDWNC